MIPTRQLMGIQYLRGIAALMVAYFHLVGQIPAYAADLGGGSWIDSTRLSGGVDIFFVISGFIMVVSSQKLDAAEFARRRLIRIVPLYWLLTLLLAGICFVAPAVFRSTHLSAAALIKSLLFVPYVDPHNGGDAAPLLVPGWSLNIEMLFYLVFTLSLIGPLRRFQIPFIVVVFVILLLARFFGVPGDVLHFYANPRLMEFCAGIVLGRLYLVRSEDWSAELLLVFAAPLLIGLRIPPNGFEGMIPALSIVCAVIVIERRGGLPSLQWLGLLGDASYSIYLTHVFTLGAIRALWTRFDLPGSGWAAIFAALSIGAVILAGVVCYRWIEMPMYRACQRIGARA